MFFVASAWAKPLKRLETLRFNETTATKTSFKRGFAFFQSLSRLFRFPATYFVKQRQTLLKVNYRGPYRSAEREIKFRRCVFTSSIKNEIRHFHVVIVCSDSKEMYKKVWCTCEVVVFLIKLVAFLRMLLGSFSNDHDDGNENGKKAIGLISKTTTLHFSFCHHHCSE